MASVKISDLTAKTDIESTDLLVIETSGGLSRKTTPAKIFTDITDVSGRVSTLEAAARTTVGKSASYVILDGDGYGRIECDTTSGDITITLPLKANNTGREITIANVKGGTNKVIIAPNATDANKLSNDGLNAIWLPKIGDFVTFKESAASGFWEITNERITAHLHLDAHAGYGTSDTKIERFTTSVRNVGNMFSENHSTGYASNAEGLKITANRSGRYAFSYGRAYTSTNSYTGLSLNSTQLTTNVQSITSTTRLSLYFTTTANAPQGTAVTLYLKKGDIVRPHSDGATGAATDNFICEYIG